MCREHFLNHFLRKFKKHLSKNKLLEKNETLNPIGENSEAVKFLIKDLGRKVDSKFSKKGRTITSYSLDTKAVKHLASLMSGKKEDNNTSFLECFTQEEIEHFSKIKKIKTGKPKFNDFENKLSKHMKELSNRRPNLYYCTYNMMNELAKVIKKSR